LRLSDQHAAWKNWQFYLDSLSRGLVVFSHVRLNFGYAKQSKMREAKLRLKIFEIFIFDAKRNKNAKLRFASKYFKYLF